MKTWIKTLGIAGLLTSAVAFADAVIFSGNDVKTLKPNIDLYGQGKILSGSVDPTSVATSAPVGSIYLNTSNGNLYRKVDAGLSTNWQKVGSAAVAGNLLPNPDWETASTGWTASAGTYARTTTAANVGFGAGSGSWDASASSQTLTSTSVAIPTGLYAANGLARCYFKTTATDYVLQAYDGTNVLASATIPASTQYQQYGVNFPFPSSGSVSLRVVSASDAAVIYMDDCYVGPAANLQSVNQAQLVGTIKVSGCSAPFERLSASFGDSTPALTGCTYTTTGSIQAPTSSPSQLGVRLVNQPPGEYVFTFTGLYGSGNSSTASVGFRFSDGTNVSREIAVIAPGTAASTRIAEFSGSISYSNAISDSTIRIQAQTDGVISALWYGTAGTPGVIRVYRFPSTSELAYRPDQVAWRVDARIGGAVVNNASGELTNVSLALASASDSLPVGIACNSTNPSVVGATTCASGTEAVGVTFVLPTAGVVEACWGSNWYNSSGTGSSVSFQLVETSNSGNTAIQTPSSFSYQGLGTATQAEFNIYNTGNCAQFNFASAGQKTLKLFGNSTSGALLIDGGTAADMNRKFFVTIKPITQSIPAPLLVGSVTSSSTGLERIESAFVAGNSAGTSACTTSPCTVVTQSGSWLSSVTRASTGVYTANITAGIFSSAPRCQVTCAGLAVPACFGRMNGAATSSSFLLVTRDSTAGQDEGFYISCMGPR